MYLGKVIGRVVSSVKDRGLEGRTLLLILGFPMVPLLLRLMGRRGRR